MKNEIATREEIKTEAIRRMEYFDLSKQCVSAFRNDGKVWQSENGGFLYEVEEDVQNIISQLEGKRGCLVYHVVKNYMAFVGSDETMVLYSFLYVDKYREDWEGEDADAKSGIVYAYVYNETIPEFSETGTIYIRPNIGGLVRTDQPFDYEKYQRRGWK